MEKLKTIKQLAAEHAESAYDEALHAPWTRLKPLIEGAFLAGAEAALKRVANQELRTDLQRLLWSLDDK